ncbi:ABC transporter ATP-binding protein [Aquirufa antheringensis]|uniref:ABC transporter ATP-binding protein n=1 Tax=Aquirufa antheringensis TaxID=2516559 RepID=UPI0022A9B436|nr:ABC transporter ATP-binding protein [Aquirufa antheringensis]MCZ2485653.1 ABC transporter ATP-binding protein [Aquirufa antheringensis]
MIITEHINKRFGNQQVLKDVHIMCRPGACIALIGPNGSGKTTLIKSILQMVLPDTGKVIFQGEDITGQWSYRAKIGFMPQMTRYPENMSIGEVMSMMIDIRKDQKNLDEELIDQYHLKEIYHKRMGTLSGGMRQKVGACLAFLFQPDILILDEPTAGLDPLSSEILKQKILKEKAKGISTIISSHVLSELDEMITEVIYMQDGQVLFQKTLEDLQQETHEVKLSKMIAKIIA